jgi:hypothetical protein
METIIWAIPAGTADRAQEDLIYGGGRLLTAEQIERVKAAAGADGYHSFRVKGWDGSPPNFAGTVGR